MDMLDKYILIVLNQIGSARKLSFLQQMMAGKRTGQMVQEAHLFKIPQLFGLTPTISEELLKKRISSLYKAGYLEETQSGVRTSFEVPEPFFAKEEWDGFRIGSRAETFFRRLELIIQVLSNRKHGKKHYFPVIRDKEVQHFTKWWLKEYPEAENELKSELFCWLNEKKVCYPELYVARFTGGEYAGKTAEQICANLGISLWDGYFYFLNGLQQLFFQKKQCPILASVMPSKIAALTFSGYQTYLLYKEGHDLSSIARIRNLKRSTIEDHFVEIKAMYPEMNFAELPDQAIIKQIKAANWGRLKEIKEAFPTLDYLGIRLAIVS